MLPFDFDLDTQDYIDEMVKGINVSCWEDWFKIDSRDSYKNYILENSGLKSVKDLWVKVREVETKSNDFSVELKSFIESESSSKPLILCHSSGTTNSDLSALKWFHMSYDIISRYWAPGMKAIFESSGLNSSNSVVIFVPSRLNADGINAFDEKEYCSLYSSEFSQRVMLAATRPKAYLLNEYKVSKSLDIISQILSLDNIAAISAPALTILGWANREKLKIGIQKSLSSIQRKRKSTEKLDALLDLIKKEGLNNATAEIQKQLSKKLKKATVIFSISSLSESNWNLIRNFMDWNQGEEKFTNLYVASEIGPIASSLGNFELSRSNLMYTFPLFLPMLKYKNEIEFISESSSNLGKLFVSKTDKGRELININLGDVISVAKNQSLPLINGKILRSSFRIKYPIKFHQSMNLSNNISVYAGDYFVCDNFEIIEPRKYVQCLNKSTESIIDAMILIINDTEKRLILPNNYPQSDETIFKCLSKSLQDAIIENELELENNPNKLVNFQEKREIILAKVRKGILPKGILKKWPLYVLVFN